MRLQDTGMNGAVGLRRLGVSGAGMLGVIMAEHNRPEKDRDR